MSVELRQYQKDLLNNLWKSLRNNNRILVQAPTGSGKTVMASALMQKLVERGERVAFIVDREELVKQSYRTFGEVSIVKAGYEDYFNPECPIQIIMIQTFDSRKDRLPDMDLSVVMIDECHNNWGTQRINELLKIYDNAKVIGWSATPIQSNGYLLNGFDDYVESVQSRELIKMGFLAPTIDYTFESYALDVDKVRIVNGDYSTEDIDDQVLDINNVKMIVDEWERLASDRKTLVFCNSIKHATIVFNEFKSRGYNFALLHSKNSNRGCLDLLEKGLIQGVVNVSITIAGMDIKDISCIVNARPTKIERIARQLIGRGRRIADGKTNNLHLDFANYVQNFGCTDDDRYFTFKPKKENETTVKQCPNCGSIEPIDAKECTICGFEFKLIEDDIEKGCGKPKSKKELERLIKMKSMQDEMYSKIKEMVIERRYKRGFAYFLYRGLLKNAKSQGTGLTYYKKMLNRIEKCKKKGYNLKWLHYQ